MDGFSGEARIKKPTAKTPPRQGEGEIPGLEIDVDVHSHSTDFLCSFCYYKKAKFDTIKRFSLFYLALAKQPINDLFADVRY